MGLTDAHAREVLSLRNALVRANTTVRALEDTLHMLQEKVSNMGESCKTDEF